MTITTTTPRNVIPTILSSMESTTTEDSDPHNSDYLDVVGFENTNNHTDEYDDHDNVEQNAYSDEEFDVEKEEKPYAEEEDREEEEEAEEQIPLHVCFVIFEIIPNEKQQKIKIIYLIKIFALSHPEIRNNRQQPWRR